MSKIRVGIVGYGNLGKGVQAALTQNSDMELVGIFSRRAQNIKFFHTMSEIKEFVGKIDVMILCGGSAQDLPVQTPELARYFNTVDSFDTHAKIPEYFDSVNLAAKTSDNISLISIGWDPGLFSLNRVIGEAVLPVGKSYTFWGKGLSQGHSDAIRHIKGVKDGVQYTIPSTKAINSVRCGENPELTMYNSHKRECFVVADEGANLDEIRNAITTMPNYFAGYETTVNFISAHELKENHSAMAHGGFVIRSGTSANKTHQVCEYALTLGSNPEFTASTLVAYARAAWRMRGFGMSGAKTVFDVAPAWLSPKTDEELRKNLL